MSIQKSIEMKLSNYVARNHQWRATLKHQFVVVVVYICIYHAQTQFQFHFCVSVFLSALF